MAIETNELIDVQTLPPFKRFIMTIGNLPTSYLESMTYGELLMWFCNYLQETVIPTVNNNGLAVEELQGLYVELHDYVQNYFDNLDVQDEINDKLNKMALDGTLTNLIKGYVDPYINAQNQEISSFKEDIENQIDIINTKVDDATSGSPLVASDVSEMTETDRVYVNTTDGYWYYYDGNSWEQGGVYQSSELGDEEVDVQNLVNSLKTSLNCSVIGTDSFTSGYYIDNSGNINTHATHSILENIQLNKGDILVTTLKGGPTVALVSIFKRYRLGNHYFPLIMGDSTDKQIVYTAQTGGYYALCGVTANLNDVKIYRKNKTTNVVDDIKLESIDNIIAIDNDELIADKYIIGGNGNAANASEYANEWWVTDFIEIKPKKKLVLFTNAKQLAETTTTYIGMAFYTENKSYISGYNYEENVNKKELTIPDNAYYIRATVTSAMKLSGYYFYYLDNNDEETTESKYPLLYKSLLRVGCIGDSMASGECYYKNNGVDTPVDIYEHSWPQYMARMSGNTYFNFSKGGLTTRGWLTSIDHGYPVASQPDKICDAYIIGLGVNDANTLGSGYLGNINDINVQDYTTNLDTYYGNYAGIIQRMQVLQPKAKFFLLTMPRTGELYESYNQAVRDIAELLDNCYVIDLATDYLTEFVDNSFNGHNKRAGHFNAIAYNNIAEQFAKWISKYMYLHYEDFEQVEFIGTNYEWTA